MKLLLLIAALAAGVPAGTAKRVVCYFANWSVYGNEPFKVDNIDATLCTHIVYSFLGLDENGFMKSFDPWNDYGDDWTEGGLKKFLRLKGSNPSVKLIMGVGGWNQGPLNFQAVVKSPEKRKRFVESSLYLIKSYSFDGMEIDWMYQDTWGGTPADKAGLSALIKEMKVEYNKAGYVLSIATSANLRVVDNSYDIPTLTQNVDFISVMTYDLHGSWDSKTGHVSPLYSMSSETAEQRLNNVDAIVKKYIERGANPEKLNVGLISYGRTFTLIDPSNHGMNAPTKAPGRVEPLPYRTFCVQDINGQWKKFWQEEQKVPYAVSGDQWVGYEDVRSLAEKVKFVKSMNLGGVTFWTFDMDDFKGNCGSGKFPLLRAVKEQISKNNQ